MSKKYKFAVGIPSYKEAESISFVLEQVDKGLSCYFNPSKCLIINLDSKSPDQTKENFLRTKTICSKKYMVTPRGKGRAMFCFFKFCLENKISYLATIDADLKTITPQWIYKLLNPIIHGYDYIIPVYTRNRFEANITNHFAYPLILANYGVKLRQPLGGEFGYSAGFCQYLLKQPNYLKIYEYGVDIFISCCALTGGFKIKEIYLGKKIHAPSFYHMESTFRQVFESGIFITKIYQQLGYKIGKIEHNSQSGGVDKFKYFPHKKAIPRLKKQLHQRFLKYKNKGFYNLFITNKPLIEKIAFIIKNEDLYSLDNNLWTDYLSYLLKSCYQRTFNINNLKIISRITIPIYRWRAMTYWLSVENSKPDEAEKIIKDQAIMLKNKMKCYNAKYYTKEKNAQYN